MASHYPRATTKHVSPLLQATTEDVKITPSDSKSSASGKRPGSAASNNAIATPLPSLEVSEYIQHGDGTDRTIRVRKRKSKHSVTFRCPLCGKPFTSGQQLQSHLRSHNSRTPSFCFVYGKSCFDQEDQQRHEDLHLGEHEFICEGELKTGGRWGWQSESANPCLQPLFDQEGIQRQPTDKEHVQSCAEPKHNATREGDGFRTLPNVVNKTGVTGVGQPECCVGEAVPCTDSGYASAPNLDHSSMMEKIIKNSGDSGPQQPMDSSNNNTDDAKPIYSEATTLMPDIVRKSIVDVCNEIYNSLGQKVNDRNWVSISGTLSSLIKAFAVKLGSGSSSESSRRIMRFVHKHHQYVLSCPTTPTPTRSHPRGSSGGVVSC